MNISLFSMMIRNGIAANDIFNFVKTQTGLRKSSKKLLKVIMRQKQCLFLCPQVKKEKRMYQSKPTNQAQREQS